MIVASNTQKWSSLADYRKAAEQALSRLRLVTQAPEYSSSSVVVVSVVRDERTILPAFLQHYRDMGAAGFVIVDNGSDDGSMEFLAAQPDIALYSTTDSYAAANQGGLWLDGLSHQFLNGRWCVRVDADEFLVFDGCERGVTLPDLVARLSSRSELRMLAPLLDLYPSGPIRDAVFDAGKSPLALPLFYDGAADTETNTERGPIITGGVRHRTFKARGANPPWLTKYPLALYDDKTAFIHVHFPVPFERNWLPVFGRLLHLKFLATIGKKMSLALAERQYSCGSAEYMILKDVLNDGRAMFRGSASRSYGGSPCLIESGLMRPFPEPTASALQSHRDAP